jgi:ribosomal protein S20
MKAIAKTGTKKKVESVKKVQSLIAKAAKKKVIHKNKAARLQSRLMS